jgi:hypothetical protein
MRKHPTYNAFVKYLFDVGYHSWNPEEHESWELPPAELAKLYFEIYPLGNGGYEVVDYVPNSHYSMIQKFIDEQ